MARERSGGPSPPEEGAATPIPLGPHDLQARTGRGDRPLGVRIPLPPPFDSPASWQARLCTTTTHLRRVAGPIGRSIVSLGKSIQTLIATIHTGTDAIVRSSACPL